MKVDAGFDYPMVCVLASVPGVGFSMNSSARRAFAGVVRREPSAL